MEEGIRISGCRDTSTEIPGWRLLKHFSLTCVHMWLFLFVLFGLVFLTCKSVVLFNCAYLFGTRCMLVMCSQQKQIVVVILVELFI